MTNCILELVRKDIKELKASLEMSDEKAATLEKETNKLKGTVNKIETEVNDIKGEHRSERSLTGHTN